MFAADINNELNLSENALWSGIPGSSDSMIGTINYDPSTIDQNIAAGYIKASWLSPLDWYGWVTGTETSKDRANNAQQNAEDNSNPQDPDKSGPDNSSNSQLTNAIFIVGAGLLAFYLLKRG